MSTAGARVPRVTQERTIQELHLRRPICLIELLDNIAHTQQLSIPAEPEEIPRYPGFDRGATTHNYRRQLCSATTAEYDVVPPLEVCRLMLPQVGGSIRSLIVSVDNMALEATLTSAVKSVFAVAAHGGVESWDGELNSLLHPEVNVPMMMLAWSCSGVTALVVEAAPPNPLAHDVARWLPPASVPTASGSLVQVAMGPTSVVRLPRRSPGAALDARLVNWPVVDRDSPSSYSTDLVTKQRVLRGLRRLPATDDPTRQR